MSRSRPPSAQIAARRGVAANGPPLLRPSVVFSQQKLHVGVGGCAAFYSAALTCAPDSSVTLSPCNLPTSLRVAPSLQVFTPSNWATPQWFRVAAVGGAAFENDTPLGIKDDGKLLAHVIDHTTSSTDPRFHALKPAQLIPGPVVVHVSPRDGGCVITSGRVLGTARYVGKGTVNKSHHDFRPIDLELPATGGSSNTSSSTSAVVQAAAASRLSVVSGSSRVLSRRSTQDDLPSCSATSGASSGDGHTFLKVACRKNQTVLLQRNGCVLTLGKREISESLSSSTQPLHNDSEDSASEAALSKMLVDVDCGDDHVVAVTEHGYLLTWGEGKDGRLGHGDEQSRSQPRLLKALLHKRVTQIACDGRHTLALAEDGDVYAWGYGKCGALGLATSPLSKAVDASVLLPMEVLTLKSKSVVRLSCGDMHSAAVLANGSLLTCGWAEHGRLGRPANGAEFSSCFLPVALPQDDDKCTFVACGGAHTLALTANHQLLAFGSNGSGQLGVGDLRHRMAPTRVAYFDGDDVIVITVAAGKLHSLAVTQDKRVFAWGSDEFGQCGVGSFPQLYTVPHLVPSAAGLGAAQISGGDSHSVLICQLSQRHLDAIEANQPTRYAAMMNRFEHSVREDKARRAVVLRAAKEKQDAHDAAVRQRRPPTASVKRVAQWQSQLQTAAVAASRMVESGSPAKAQARPQTAALSSRNRAARPATGGTVVSPRMVTSPVSVRCSSATLWRHTRLFTFQPPTKDRGEKMISLVPGTRQQLKLTTQARQTLGRIFNGEDDEHETLSQAQKAQPDQSTATEQLAKFPPSRPKSAPSRASTKAS